MMFPGVGDMRRAPFYPANRPCFELPRPFSGPSCSTPDAQHGDDVVAAVGEEQRHHLLPLAIQEPLAGQLVTQQPRPFRELFEAHDLPRVHQGLLLGKTSSPVLDDLASNTRSSVYDYIPPDILLYRYIIYRYRLHMTYRIHSHTVLLLSLYSSVYTPYIGHAPRR